MRSYLIVANQTLASRSLAEAITDRLADGPIRAYVVVPLVPGHYSLVVEPQRFLPSRIEFDVPSPGPIEIPVEPKWIRATRRLLASVFGRGTARLGA